MIYVTHDQVEAMTLADKIVLLNAGEAMQRDGSIAQVGRPLDLYHRPANLFVAGFIGSPKMNVLSGTLAGATAARAEVRLRDGTHVSALVDATALPAGANVTLGIRPEHVEVAPNGTVTGRASHVEQLGEASYLYLDSPSRDGFLTVRQEGDTAAVPGDAIAVALPERHCHLFGPDGRALPRHLPVGATAAAQQPSATAV